jgi:hypothetical protein
VPIDGTIPNYPEATTPVVGTDLLEVFDATANETRRLPVSELWGGQWELIHDYDGSTLTGLDTTATTTDATNFVCAGFRGAPTAVDSVIVPDTIHPLLGPAIVEAEFKITGNGVSRWRIQLGFGKGSIVSPVTAVADYNKTLTVDCDSANVFTIVTESEFGGVLGAGDYAAITLASGVWFKLRMLRFAGTYSMWIDEQLALVENGPTAHREETAFIIGWYSGGAGPSFLARNFKVWAVNPALPA